MYDLECSAADAGVPLPRPLPALDGGPCADVPNADGKVVTTRAWPWIDLRALPQPAGAEAVLQLGMALGRLHSLPAPADPRPLHPYYCEPPGDDEWAPLHQRALAAREPWAEALAEQIPDLRRLADLARAHPPRSRSRWCHFDLTDANVRLRAGGGLAVIDWDDAQVGDPDRELGWAAATWCEPSTARTLADGYREHGGPGSLDDIGALAMAACIHCRWTHAAASGALDAEPSAADRAAWIEQMLGRGLTLERLRAIWEAARSG